MHNQIIVFDILFGFRCIDVVIVFKIIKEKKWTLKSFKLYHLLSRSEEMAECKNWVNVFF